MRPLRPQLRGLIFKLTVFYILLSLPSLLLVESAILIFEFNGFMASVERGSLAKAANAAARELADLWPRTSIDAMPYLRSFSEALVLRLQSPRGGLAEESSFILVELSAEPIAAAVFDMQGQLLARAPTGANARAGFSLPEAADFALAAGVDAPVSLAGTENPYRTRRFLSSVRDRDGTLRGYLFVELRLPVPWHRFFLDLSLEWPIVLGYLLVFGIASSFFLATWVTRRLNRVARAATAWSSGDFSGSIGDTSRDELGNLSALLDRMALELKALLRSRGQLATMAERQRLARDLHDTVKQKAFALSMQLATVRRQLGEHPAIERLTHAEHISQQIQYELVSILDELRSDTLLIFSERLRLRATEWAQVSGLQLTLDLDEAQSGSDSTQDSLMRILDEALANILRHSGASSASLTLHEHNGLTQMTIADNGRGLDSDAGSGMGLNNMRERAEELPDGRFEFFSAASGTRICISFSDTGSASP